MIVNSYSNDETVLEAESGKIFVHTQYKIMYDNIYNMYKFSIRK